MCVYALWVGRQLKLCINLFVIIINWVWTTYLYCFALIIRDLNAKSIMITVYSSSVRLITAFLILKIRST